MTEEVFKQSRKRITPEDLSGESPLESVRKIQEAVAQETGQEIHKPFDPNQLPFQISGNVPPALKQMLEGRNAPGHQMAGSPLEEDDGFEPFEAPPERKRAQPKPTPDAKIKYQGSDQFESILKKLSATHQWEQFEFPSKGKFYTTIPPVVHIRAMTGEEEQILATPRWVKKGKAIDMIFRKCIREPINTEELLSADRTHLLIFLRGISYTPEYDVEIKCPNCGIKFAHVVDLDQIEVKVCPDDFGPDSLSGVLPKSGLRYRYRLATGMDEQEISSYRERRIANWGDQGDDDTLLYRTALLLDEIEGVTMKKELAALLRKLPINDVAHLRNEINQPPFGVETELPILCPNAGCSEEFKIDMPLETNFFFPRKKDGRTQA